MVPEEHRSGLDRASNLAVPEPARGSYCVQARRLSQKGFCKAEDGEDRAGCQRFISIASELANDPAGWRGIVGGAGGNRRQGLRIANANGARQCWPRLPMDQNLAGGDGGGLGRSGGCLHRGGAAAGATRPRQDDGGVIGGGDCGFHPTALLLHLHLLLFGVFRP